jgi:hypothetical protein
VRPKSKKLYPPRVHPHREPGFIPFTFHFGIRSCRSRVAKAAGPRTASQSGTALTNIQDSTTIRYPGPYQWDIQPLSLLVRAGHMITGCTADHLIIFGEAVFHMMVRECVFAGGGFEAPGT